MLTVFCFKFRLMHVHPCACVCIINEKTKGKFPGEHYVVVYLENKTYKVKKVSYFESKQDYFSYSLDKAFHLPEFQAKLFFTRNWVESFY